MQIWAIFIYIDKSISHIDFLIYIVWQISV